MDHGPFQRSLREAEWFMVCGTWFILNRLISTITITNQEQDLVQTMGDHMNNYG